MEIKTVLSKCDYTLLDRCAKRSDIAALIDGGIKYGVASVCIPPYYVKFAKGYTDKLPICTVIGFPNGYNTIEAKVYEAQRAVGDGADELDAVINVGQIKDGNFDEALKEIAALRKVSKGKVLKIIIETCLLTDEEKIKMCKTVTEGGADFIKTSTGFSSEGATEHNVRLLTENVGHGVKVKAAGGIRTVEAAERFIMLGAERIGTSSLIKDALSKGLI